ncbi:hypothetical protein O7983_000317 [Mycoplasmopsis felis]|uniref:protein translocase subunit SecDF n=1 Tax=Mycoplasmopsis felis TaxID=33923 RepID=UPI003A4E270C
MYKYKKIFSSNKYIRIIFSFFMIISAILSIVFGSFFYLNNNVKTSSDYGNGIKIVAQSKVNSENSTLELTEKINKSIQRRILGTDVKTLSPGFLEIQKSGQFSEKEKNDLENELLNKPSIIVTDNKNNSLFVEGLYKKTPILDKDIKNFNPPFQLGGAEYSNSNFNNSHNVLISLDGVNGKSEWAKMINDLSQDESNQILIWLNYEKLKTIAENEYPVEWEKSGKDLWKFIHVNEELTHKDSNNRDIPNSIKENVLEIQKKYLISVLNPKNISRDSKITISNNLSNTQANELSNNINFALSDYDINLVSSTYIENINKAFFYTLISLLIIFSLISLFMIYNYGLLGLINALSGALYLFLTNLINISLGGFYSPIMFLFMILNYWYFIDLNIIIFEKIKKNIFLGDTLKKSLKNSYRDNLYGILDSNILILISGLLLFFFGYNLFNTYGVIFSISSIVILFIILFFNRFLNEFIINNDFWSHKLFLAIGYKKKFQNYQSKIETKISNANIFKFSNYLSILFFAFILIGVITFSVLSGINQNILSGLNSSFEFAGGNNVIATGKQTLNNYLTYSSGNELINNLKTDLNFSNSLIFNLFKNSQADDKYTLFINSSNILNNEEVNLIIQKINSFDNTLLITSFTTLPIETHKLLINLIVIFGIFIILLFIYFFVKLGWTYSLSALIGFIFLFLGISSALIVFRIQLNTFTILSIILSLNLFIYYSYIVLDSLKKLIKEKYHKYIMNKDETKKAISQNLSNLTKRNLNLFLIFIFSCFVFFAFNNIINIWYTLFLMISVILIYLISNFILMKVFLFFETRKQNILKKRKDSGYWDINKREEQLFIGINDFE